MKIEKRKYGILDVIRIPLQCAPILTVLVGLQTLISGIVPTINVVVTAYFINTAISIVRDQSSMTLIFPSLFAIVGLIAYTWISGELGKFAQIRMELAIRDKFRTAVTDKRARLAYQHIESHDTWDLISRVSRSPEVQIKTAYNDLISMTAGLLQIGGILLLLIAQVWWAALLILAFSIPLFGLAIKSGRANYDASREVSKYKRKYEYLSGVLTGREAVEERSLFGYGEKVNDTWYDQYETARKIQYKTEKKWFIKMKTGSLLTAMVSILIVLVLLQPVLTGVVSIGMFISLVNAVFGLVQMMSWQLTYYVDQLAKHKEYLKDLSEFGALEEAEDANALPAAPSPPFYSLEFKNVRFRYPGTEMDILQDMSFKIDAGRHYAFVGINGAGKTTITKLITGLYDNFEGDILINGKEISKYTQGELKAFFSVVYQDFAKYFISMKDNIALGDIHRAGESSHERLQDAIDSVNLNQAAQKLPQGIETPLGKIKEGGQDVSGGEWQRIAMARAVINPAPLRILDEPTAALDPISESRLYGEFENISRDKTTIFISHRLGSTKLAHEIFVIGDGRVIEKGTHQQLMDHGGIYAKMYENQRSWYQ